MTPDSHSTRTKVRGAGHIDPTVAVHICDCRDLPVAPASASVVVIDPPWSKVAVNDGIYATAAELSARWLKPGGFALVYASHDSLPEVIEQTGRHLTYCWPLVLGYSKNKAGYRLSRFKTCHHFILLYSLGTPAPAPAKQWTHDLITVPHESDGKKWHPWQQSRHGLEVFLNALTEPGDLVVDPFAGSGTTAVVVKGLGGRHVITGDRDPKAVKTVHARLARDVKTTRR